jgi:HAD superfamily hydrolase (TIGR01549 family)
VLFDLGNTLIYFEGRWRQVIDEMNQAVTAALCDLGYRLDRESFPQEFGAMTDFYFQRRDEEYIEYTSQEILRQALEQNHIYSPEPEHLRQAIAKMYTVSQAHWHCEEDTIPMLETLLASGRRLGIISNASDDLDVQQLIDNAGIRQYFEIIITSAAFGHRKPGEMIFQYALDFWGARPDQAVMVGDTLAADILGANQLGIASVWIRRRVNTPENQELAKKITPRAIIDTIGDLPALLDRQDW